MTNQNNQEITKIQEQTDTDYLRRYVRQCESEIMRLSYDENNKELFILSNEDRILEQAEIRCALLNRMFELHCSEANIRIWRRLTTDLSKWKPRFWKFTNRDTNS